MGVDDIERIEVVKGPQAVYFGRQTFSGAINYVSRKPTFDWQGDLRAEYAEDNDYRFSGSVSGPLVEDVLAFRIYGQIGRDDGAFANTLDRFRVQTEETQGGSASVTLRPSSDVSFTARAQYVEFDDGHNAAVLVGADQNTCLPNTGGVNQAICGIVPTPDEIALNLTGLEFPGGRRTVTQERYSLLGSIGLGNGFEISTITAYNKESNINSSDGDATPTPVFGFTFRSEGDDFTQQVILNSSQREALRFSLGGIYFESERTKSSVTFPFSSPSTPVSVENYGIFGGVEYDFTDQITLGLEARYSIDKIARVGTEFENTFKAFLPRATLDYKPNEDTLIYAVVAKGNQPGSFNTGAGLSPEQQIVDEESIWNYELGFRQQFMDGRGLFSANAYYIDWDGQVVQVTVERPLPLNGLPPTAVINGNGGETRIFGAELEGSYEITEAVTLRGTYAYNNAEYRDFISNRPVRFGGDPQVGGNKLQNTPEHMASLALSIADRFSDTSNWGYFGSVVGTYRSEQFLDETNTAKIGSATVVNGQIGVDNGAVRLTGFVRNLTNEDTPSFGTIFSDFSRGFQPAYLLSLREPRTVGVRMEFTF